MHIAQSHVLLREVQESLGLKNIRHLTMRFHWDALAEVEVVMFPEEDVIRRLPPVLKKFKLVPIEDSPPT